MDYTILDELIKITKKNDAPKAKKQQYLIEMVALLKEEGFSKISQTYLREGFSFDGARPLIDYLFKMEPENRNKAAKEFLKCDIMRENEKAIAFKFELELLAYCLNYAPTENFLVEELIKDIPLKTKNKTKKPFKDIQKIFEKNFLKELDNNAPMIDLQKVDVKPGFLKDFIKLFVELIENVSEQPALGPKKKKVKDWIFVDLSKEKPQKQKACNKKELVIQEIPKTEENKVDIDRFVQGVTLQEYESFEKTMTLFMCKVKETVIEAENIKKTLAKKNKEINKLTQELSFLKTEKSEMICSLTTLQQEAEEMGKRLASLETENHNQKLEIEKAKSVVSIYSIDKQNAQSEQLNAIAAKLKAEYRDFLDAKDMEMSVDLGENLRYQLESVFKILIKAGIDVERR